MPAPRPKARRRCSSAPARRRFESWCSRRGRSRASGDRDLSVATGCRVPQKPNESHVRRHQLASPADLALQPVPTVHATLPAAHRTRLRMAGRPLYERHCHRTVRSFSLASGGARRFAAIRDGFHPRPTGTVAVSVPNRRWSHSAESRHAAAAATGGRRHSSPAPSTIAAAAAADLRPATVDADVRT